MAANELPSPEAGADEEDVGGSGGGGGGAGAGESDGGVGGGAVESEGGVGGAESNGRAVDGEAASRGEGAAEELTGGIGEVVLTIFEILDFSLAMDVLSCLSLLLNLLVIRSISDGPFVEEDFSLSTC